MAASPKKIKEQLMQKIDLNNELEIEKIERYVDLVLMNKKIKKTINKDGLKIIVRNGNQVFEKSHPLISEFQKNNAALLAIEKSFNFKVEENISARDVLLND